MSTTVNVTSTGQTFNLPGNMTPQQVVNMIGNDVPGLAGMSSSVEGAGTDNVVITFSARVGNKGAVALAA